MAETLLSFENLGKQYGYQWAVRKAGGKICSKDYIALFGVNGAGKSTLLYLLSGVYRAHEGRIDTVFEKSRGKIFLMSHQSMFYNRLNAIENLKFFQSLYNDSGVAPGDDQIEAVLKYTGLYNHRFKRVEGYSRGMIQRLMISRMVLAKPALVFFDEPFTGLDIQGQGLLVSIIKERGVAEFQWAIDSFLYVDHEIERAYEYSEKVWMIEPGKLHDLQLKGEAPLKSVREMLEHGA